MGGDATDVLLNEFYDDPSHDFLNTPSSMGGRSLAHPLDDEGDDLFNSENEETSFRRRRVDYYDKSCRHPPRNDVYDSAAEYDRVTKQRSDNYDLYSSQPQKLTSKSPPERLTWNKLNAALFVGLGLLSAATTAPITLIPTMSLSLAGAASGEQWNYAPYYQILEVYDSSGRRKRWIPFRIRTSGTSNNKDINISSSSIFASHLTSVVTLVTALGKFINGAIVDIAGARRLLVLYGLCTCLALLGLRYSTTPNQAIVSCAAIDFFSSINWSSGIVILGAHYGKGNNSGGSFERGLYVTSLACRCGSLLTIPLSSLLMKWTNITWRGIAGLASFLAFCGVLVFYVYVSDSPGRRHDPQNPIRTILQFHGIKSSIHFDSFHPPWTETQPSICQRATYFCYSVTRTVLPSIHEILISPVFWAVAAAHAGATMVKQSERILGTYFRDTSYGVVTESKASAMTVFLSLGMLAGLLIGGKAFAKAAESEQERHSFPYNTESNRHEKSSLTDAAQISTKNMIAFLYCFAICMCYMLSFFAVPFVRRALRLPVLVLIFQVLATLGLGFGIAVQYYHIPPIVSATYGKNRGLYTAYTEGIAGLLSSIVWRIVGGAVEEGNPQVGGWAYGWAAIALLLVFCGTLMVTIVEIYFVGGGWRRDTPHENNEITLPVALTTKVNSWMDASPLRKSGRLNALSSSALDFIGSSARIPSHGTKPLLTSIDSCDGEDAASGDHGDLLGIDDDGSFLFPAKDGHQYDGTHSLNSEDPYKGQYNDCPFNSFEL